VRWYLRYALSYRDLEEMMKEYVRPRTDTFGYMSCPGGATMENEENYLIKKFYRAITLALLDIFKRMDQASQIALTEPPAVEQRAELLKIYGVNPLFD
jgi:hypothetical protein